MLYGRTSTGKVCGGCTVQLRLQHPRARSGKWLYGTVEIAAPSGKVREMGYRYRYFVSRGLAAVLPFRSYVTLNCIWKSVAIIFPSSENKRKGGFNGLQRCVAYCLSLLEHLDLKLDRTKVLDFCNDVSSHRHFFLFFFLTLFYWGSEITPWLTPCTWFKGQGGTWRWNWRGKRFRVCDAHPECVPRQPSETLS